MENDLFEVPAEITCPYCKEAYKDTTYVKHLRTFKHKFNVLMHHLKDSDKELIKFFENKRRTYIPIVRAKYKDFEAVVRDLKIIMEYSPYELEIKFHSTKPDDLDLTLTKWPKGSKRITIRKLGKL